MRKFHCALIAAAALLLLVRPVFASPVVPGDVLVVFKHSTLAGAEGAMARVNAVAAETGAGVKATYDALSVQGEGFFALLHSDSKSAQELAGELRARDDVLAAAPNYVTHIFKTPNDPYYTDASLWGLPAVNAPAAWDRVTGSGTVYVAVLDTGIQYNHPDISGNFDPNGFSRNFYGSSSGSISGYGDDNGHGTHVAGVIGAVGDNGAGVVGVNWTAKLISLKVSGADGSGSTDYVFYALNYLARLLSSNPSLRLASVNLSLGYYSPETPAQAAKSDPVWLALSALSGLNRTVICVAAGNEANEVGAPAPETKYYSDGTLACNKGEYAYPASFTGIDNMIVVGAALSATALDTRYSNYSGTYVDIAAPGTGIISTYAGSRYVVENGTSMAAPHVAGAAALLQAAYPGATASQIKAAILNGAQNASSFSGSTRYGFLDLKGALDQLGGSGDAEDEQSDPGENTDDGQDDQGGNTDDEQNAPDENSNQREEQGGGSERATGSGGGGGGCDAGLLGLGALALMAAGLLCVSFRSR